MKYDDVFTVDDETFNVEDYITEVPDFPVKGVNFKDISPLLKDQDLKIYIKDEYKEYLDIETRELYFT